MEIIKSYKVRIYPSEEQEQRLLQICGATRFVYNYYLDKRKKEYSKNKKNFSYYECAKNLTLLKNKEEYLWLKGIRIHILQQSLRDLDKAYNSFFHKRSRFPSFKSKKSWNPSFRIPCTWKFRGNKIRLEKGLLIRFRGTDLPSDAVLKSLTISRDTDGKWYGSIISREEVNLTKKTGNPIGVDLGLTHLAITSDGKKYDTFRPKKKQKKKMKLLQQDFSRKRSGSKRRAKAKQSLAVLHKKIANQRMNYLHQTSHRITSENQAVIVCEDLAVKNMVRNHSLADAISESGWAEFVRQLEYKQIWRGGQFAKIDRFFPSSKTCSSCGYIVDSLPLSVRQWTCSSCNAQHDRDVNAAKMVLAQGLSDRPEWRVQRVS